MQLGLAMLPIELIDRITQVTAYDDCLVLSRTNRTVHAVCMRWLYRTIILLNHVRAIGCFKTLILNLEAAHCVRRVVIYCSRFRPEPEWMLRAFCRVLAAALRNLTRVEFIDVSHSAKIFATISHLHFPHLRECAIPFSIDLVRFLQLHPALIAISIDPVPEASITFPASFSPITMPKLRIFNGPDSVAAAAIPGSAVTS
ncbi:hypothetical protein C8R43DRAFT_907614, partial [Mycena crocata]